MIDLQHLSQRVAVRLCRAVGRPLFGNRIGEAPYEAIGRDLKSRGFKFVGPTIVYAWMQAVGIVNDHDRRCFRRDAV